MSNIPTGAARMPHDLSHIGFLAGQIGRLITISTTPVIAGDSFEMDAVGALRLSPLRRGLAIDSTVDIVTFYVAHRHVSSEQWIKFMQARYFHRKGAWLVLGHYAVAWVLRGLPTARIARQPDLGTALMVAAAGFYVIFLPGLSWKFMAGGTAAVLASLPILWGVLHDYQRRRFLTLLDPSSDPLGAGYHIIQSTIAVGSGGVTGKGWLAGTQTHLEFIPERATDFVFAVYSEEFGLIGNSLLLALYLALIMRGLMVAANAPTLFMRLLAGSITLTFFTYAVVNMGMVSGLLPVVGVPLPLISYGGTSLVTLSLCIGILMSIQHHRTLVQT